MVPPEDREVTGFHPAAVPLLFVLSTRPEVEARLAQLLLLLEAIQDALKRWREGLHALQAGVTQLLNSTPPPLGGGQPAQEAPAQEKEVKLL